MENNLKSFYDTKTIEVIVKKLYGIKVISKDPEILNRVAEIMELLTDNVVEQDISVLHMIEEKMWKVKGTNPELHFILYKLFRRLSEGKVSEEQAYKLYRNYCE